MVRHLESPGARPPWSLRWTGALQDADPREVGRAASLSPSPGCPAAVGQGREGYKGWPGAGMVTTQVEDEVRAPQAPVSTPAGCRAPKGGAQHPGGSPREVRFRTCPQRAGTGTQAAGAEGRTAAGELGAGETPGPGREPDPGPFVRRGKRVLGDYSQGRPLTPGAPYRAKGTLPRSPSARCPPVHSHHAFTHAGLPAPGPRLTACRVMPAPQVSISFLFAPFRKQSGLLLKQIPASLSVPLTTVKSWQSLDTQVFS